MKNYVSAKVLPLKKETVSNLNVDDLISVRGGVANGTYTTSCCMSHIAECDNVYF